MTLPHGKVVRDDIFVRLRACASDTSSRITAMLPKKDATGHGAAGEQGLGDVGKTKVAAEYAHRSSSDYDLASWMPADQPPLVRGPLAPLAPRLNLETDPPTERSRSHRGEPYRRWLLVFDNAVQPEDINDLILQEPEEVLVTSRNHRWNSVINTVPMDVLLPEESKEYLPKRSSTLTKRGRPRRYSPTPSDLAAGVIRTVPTASVPLRCKVPAETFIVSCRKISMTGSLTTATVGSPAVSRCRLAAELRALRMHARR